MARSTDVRAYPEWCWRVLRQVRERGSFVVPAGGKGEALAFRAQWYAFTAAVRRAPETRAWKAMAEADRERVEEWMPTALQAGCYVDSTTWDVTVKLKALAQGSLSVMQALEAAEAGRPLRSADAAIADAELDRQAQASLERVKARVAEASPKPKVQMVSGDFAFSPRARPDETPEQREARHALCRRYGVTPLAADGTPEG